MLGVAVPCAAPIIVGNRVAGVLTVGEALGDPDDGSDLDYLASALAEAYLRTDRP